MTSAFWGAVGFSFARIAAGFAIAFALALALATAAWKLALLRELLQPLVSFMKSVPVVCVIVLLLVWMGSANVSVAAVTLMVFPPVYFACLEGLGQTSREMRDMLGVLGVRGVWRLRYYYLPAVMPYVAAASKVVVGVAWKAGIAAEVIGIPTGSVGAGIYSAKIGLDTASLFAWTFAIVGLSALCERAFLKLLDALVSRKAPRPGHERPLGELFGAAPIVAESVVFSRGATRVIEGLTCSFAAGGRYCLMAPSGAGKTTLLDLASGLAEPDTGKLERPARVSRGFQEDRLLDQLSAWGNVALVCPHLPESERSLSKFDLDELLGRDSADLAIRECSGGMKRKVALVRALAAPGEALLLDEPFAGLDDVSRTDAIAVVNRHLHGRTLVVATHDESDLAFLDAELVRL